jgi:hypothetical protein
MAASFFRSKIVLTSSTKAPCQNLKPKLTTLCEKAEPIIAWRGGFWFLLGLLLVLLVYGSLILEVNNQEHE